MYNQFEMKTLAKLENEAFIRSTICAFSSKINPSVDFIEDIKTAVSEAITNCIVHAYKDEEGYIFIKVSIIKDNTVEICIKDTGVGIEDISKAKEPFYTTKESEGRSGMGFTLMETFMDSLKVYSNKNKGTEIIMTKSIKSEE